jgi:hypothetical protein
MRIDRAGLIAAHAREVVPRWQVPGVGSLVIGLGAG